MRAHYQAPVQDSSGDLLPGTVVSIYLNGTQTLDSEPVYADGSSGTVLGNPFVTATGVIDFYLANPERVDLGIQPPGEAQVIFPDIDVNEAGASSLTLTFPGTGTSSTQVGSSANAAGTNSTALGVSATAALSGDTALGEATTASGGSSLAAGQAAVAQGYQSTAVGQGASTGSSATGGTAIGEGASAGAANATALGAGSSAGASGGTAVGQGATAGFTGSTAIGQGAANTAASQVMLGTAADTVVVPGTLSAASGFSFAGSGTASTQVGASSNAAGTDATAIGNGAQATQTGDTSLGQAAAASGGNSTAIGKSASAGGAGATALGEGASAPGTSATAIGVGAATTANHQVMLGTSAESVVVPGTLDAAVQLQIGAGATAASLASAGTISTAAVYAPVTFTGYVTGVILQAGTKDGQMVVVQNLSTTGSINFAGTGSNTDGINTTIGPGAAFLFIWNAATSMWVRTRHAIEQFITLTSTYTLANSISAQALFNVPSAGAFTAPAAGTYFFECAFDLSSMSSSSSGFAFGFGGTATYTGVRFESIAGKQSRATPNTGQSTTMTYTTTPAPIPIVTNSTTTEGFAFIKGLIRVNAAGTVIPQIQQLSASTAAVVSAGAYFRLTPISSLNSLGNFS